MVLKRLKLECQTKGIQTKKMERLAVRSLRAASLFNDYIDNFLGWFNPLRLPTLSLRLCPNRLL